MNPLTILHGDCRETLKTLPDNSVHCVVTSPPYWGLRDYGTATWEGGDAGCDHLGRSQTSGASTLGQWKSGGGQQYKENTGGMPFQGVCGKCGAQRIDSQLGLEPTPEAYVANMVAVFREVRRVLRVDGTLWLNLGDSYARNPKKGGSGTPNGRNNRGENYPTKEVPGLRILSGETQEAERESEERMESETLVKEKDIVGIPWRVAFALQADGWWLRQDIIWHKPNPMPESVTDRCTKAHEYVFLLTKSARYYYDSEAVKEKGVIPAGTLGAKGSTERFNTAGVNSRPPEYKEYDGTRNKRSVWTVTTKGYKEAHFATFPPELIKPMILAGTSARGCCPKCGAPWERVVTRQDKGHDGSEYGWGPTCLCGEHSIPCTVLDPFGGSGTTGMVANELGRKAILCELNPEYMKLIETRTQDGLALPLA